MSHKSQPYSLKTNHLNSCLFLLIALLSACSGTQQLSRSLKKDFAQNAVMKPYHVGFAIYDIENQNYVFQQNADKYYTPASNTKVYTLYTSLKMLPEQIASLRYVEKGDSLIFWGTGDPSLLHEQLKAHKAIDFLAQQNKILALGKERYEGDFYGSGWAWDDFNYYYQPEISGLPLYGNIIKTRANAENQLQVSPKFFKRDFHLAMTSNAKDFFIQRAYDRNDFSYPGISIPSNHYKETPFKTSRSLTLEMLSDTLKKQVFSSTMLMPQEAKTIYDIPRDTLLKHMMLPSDNFMAEQLLLLCANEMGQNLNTPQVIKYALSTFLSDLPDAPKWVDGSGLSSANLFTPRDMIHILNKLYKEYPNKAQLFDMFPAGGKSGTLRTAYPKTDKPFVFAKTGTLSGVHNQSGYVITKKGKTYIFSFMNNNFVLPTAEVRKQMVRIMTYVHNNY